MLSVRLPVNSSPLVVKLCWGSGVTHRFSGGVAGAPSPALFSCTCSLSFPSRSRLRRVRRGGLLCPASALPVKAWGLVSFYIFTVLGLVLWHYFPISLCLRNLSKLLILGEFYLTVFLAPLIQHVINWVPPPSHTPVTVPYLSKWQEHSSDVRPQTQASPGLPAVKLLVLLTPPFAWVSLAHDFHPRFYRAHTGYCLFPPGWLP